MRFCGFESILSGRCFRSPSKFSAAWFTPGLLSVTLLIFGIVNCAGTFRAGAVLGKHFRPTIYAIPLVLTLVAVLLLLMHGSTDRAVSAIARGFVFGFIPVGWSTWIARPLADKAELAGGISVAAIQFSIGLAAVAEGLIFDGFGITSIFIASAVVLLFAALLTKVSFTLYAKDTGQLP